jgi:hypothetical protein
VTTYEPRPWTIPAPTVRPEDEATKALIVQRLKRARVTNLLLVSPPNSRRPDAGWTAYLQAGGENLVARRTIAGTPGVTNVRPFTMTASIVLFDVE